MAQFIRIGDSLINLTWIRAVEYAGDGRLQIYLSEDRGAGLVLRYSGEEAREAWVTLSDPARVPVINGRNGSDGRAGADDEPF
jgi:hypothetical protein